ncbi:MAG: hypothetical protein JMN27_18485 [gamma proteobacterium endosymbiont of Lamellibrachia anaximandri]|nr:hypothetical protein [gamma proteobacterium endosymbiont of Lamellibrachia anaximandri]MBL3535793.1 hypothetical protein [gamma proteobacterium endosymbiont of Lamellibrachia anaximandri]
MSFINAQITMELGKEYIFTLQSDSSKAIIINGSQQTDQGDVLEISVDGKVDKYSQLQDALGEPYTRIEKA